MDLIIKGFIIGIGKILPGVSGSLLALTLGIYEKIIDAISNLKKDLINNGLFLSKIGLGIIIAITTLSKIIVKCLDKHYFATMLLFIGMIMGSMPEILNKTKLTKKNILKAIILITLIYIIIEVSNIKNVHTHVIENTPQELIKLIGIGIIDSITSIIPGISGTAILMFLGYYNIIIDTFATITQIEKINRTLFVLIPFLIGFIIGTIYISKIINKLIINNTNTSNIMALSFTTTTLIMLIKTSIPIKLTLQEKLTGILLFIIGFTTMLKTNKNKICNNRIIKE